MVDVVAVELMATSVGEEALAVTCCRSLRCEYGLSVFAKKQAGLKHTPKLMLRV